MRFLPLSGLFLTCLLFVISCQTKESGDTTTIDSKHDSFIVDTESSEGLTFEKLRVVPILATESFLKENAQFSRLINLEEAIQTKGFRITEKKPYGSRNDRESVNALTVHNKSQDTVYFMAGDVVQGGKQDRVIAQDGIVPPRSLTDVAVFCVEPHRWHYKGYAEDDESPNIALANKKAFTFSGYYNMASNDLRKTVKHSKNQEQVWAKVGELTSINNAETETGAYAALEESDDFTKQRDAYLHFFNQKIESQSNAIGMMVVSGNKVLGTDIFHNPALFQKQYKALMHGYITDAISNGASVAITEDKLDRAAKKVQVEFHTKLSKSKEKEMKFRYKGQLIHFTSL